MRPQNILIHIGAPKTASTSLQRCLFECHSGVHFFGEDGAGHLHGTDAEVAESMINDDDLHFSHDLCRQVFERHRELSVEKTLIYSNADIMASRVPTVCARRLHDFLPEAEILLIVRNQLTAIPSYYANHGAFLKPAPPRHFRKFVSFDDWMSHCTMFIKYSPLASYFYSDYLEIYADLFGRDKIHVLLFEDFVIDREKFVADLCGLLGIDGSEATGLMEDAHERKRISMRTLRFHRFRSSFLWQVPLSSMIPGGQALARRWRRWLDAGPKADGFVSDSWRQRIAELYGRSNADLIRNFGVPIRDYGYPVSPSA